MSVLISGGSFVLGWITRTWDAIMGRESTYDPVKVEQKVKEVREWLGFEGSGWSLPSNTNDPTKKKTISWRLIIIFVLILILIMWIFKFIKLFKN